LGSENAHLGAQKQRSGCFAGISLPSDFYCFGPFKNSSSRKRFEDQKTLQKTLVQYFTTLGKEHYCERLITVWDKCLNANNDCIEK
jgi:hypothetical protein